MSSADDDRDCAVESTPVGLVQQLTIRTVARCFHPSKALQETAPTYCNVRGVAQVCMPNTFYLERQVAQNNWPPEPKVGHH